MTITIKIPQKARVFVATGDTVTPNQPLFEVTHTKNVVINISEKLRVKPDSIFRYLNKIIGEEVQKGETLASKKGIMRTHKVLATHEAIIKEVSHVTGEMTLLVEDQNSISTIAPNSFLGLKGTVAKIESNSISVTLKNSEHFALTNVTDDAAAELFYFTNEGLYFTANEDDLRDKIVVIHDLKPHIEVKCEALGCAGFLYVSGKPTTVLPTASFAKKEQYDTMIQLKKNYGAFTVTDCVIAVYN